MKRVVRARREVQLLKESTMFARTGLVMATILMLAVGCRKTGDNSVEGRHVDKDYGFKIAPPENWKSMPHAGYSVPGVLRAAWSPGGQSSITVFVQPNSQHVTAKALTESNVAMLKQAGFEVKSESVGKSAGLDAMSLVIVGDGTGGAIVPGGKVRTAQHWVAIPRGEEILVFLLTTPEAELEKEDEAFKGMVRGLEVDQQRPADAMSSAPGLQEIKRCGFESDTPGELPARWARWGESDSPYRVAVDDSVGHNGKRSCRVTHTGSAKGDDQSFGGCGTGVPADEWRGKRVRLTAFVRTERAEGAACLVLRVDGKNGSLAFDNMDMNGRALSGTTDWKKCALVLDVAKEAQNIAFGLLLRGGGTMWVDDMLLEVVGTNVPTTDGSKGSRGAYS